MVGNKWIVLAFIAFIVYAYVSDQNDSPKSIVTTTPTKEATPEKLIDTVNSSDIPKLPKKDRDLIAEHEQRELAKSKIEFKTNAEKASFLEKKLMQGINYVINSPKGRELIDKVFSQTPRDEKNRYTRKPSPYSSNAQADIKIGKGYSATCGQTVKIHYKTYLTDGHEIFSSFKKNKPINFRIGSGQIAKGIEWATVGMQKGGFRKIFLPPNLSYYDDTTEDIPQGEFVAVDIELLDITPKLPKQAKMIKVFEDYAMFDNMHMRACGEKVRFNLKLLRASGSILYDSKDHRKIFSFILGNKNTHWLLTKIADGLPEKGSRTVLIPHSLVQELNLMPKKYNFYKDEIIIAEIAIIEPPTIPTKSGPTN